MRSNPNCPVCNCEATEQINKMMYNGTTPEQVTQVLTFQLAKAEKEFAQWDVEYQRKRGDETLKDTDIAERNRRLEDIKKKEDLADIPIEQLRAHEKHAAFKPNQCFKQPELDDGDILENVNFSQLQPHTMIG